MVFFFGGGQIKFPFAKKILYKNTKNEQEKDVLTFLIFVLKKSTYNVPFWWLQYEESSVFLLFLFFVFFLSFFFFSVFVLSHL